MDVDAVTSELDLERLPSGEADRRRWFRDVGLAVVLIHPQSRLKGRTIQDWRARSVSETMPLGVRRRGVVLPEFENEELTSGDEILVIGSWDRIAKLRTSFDDFVLLTRPAELEDVSPARDRMPLAVAIVTGMVLLSAFGILPVVASVLLASMAVVAAGCITGSDAYRSINWASVVLIAGLLPAADAMDQTGGADLIAVGLTDLAGGGAVWLVVSVLFFSTVALGFVFAASSVLMVPIALSVAEALGVAPHGYVMTVAIAASAGFASPFSSASMSMVATAGGYKLADFVRVGLPMVVIAWLTTIFLIPRLYPV